MNGKSVTTQQIRTLLIGIALAVLVAGVYLQAVGFGFVFDDRVYITENAPIHQGLSWAGIWWAISGLHVAFWHPLTWLSHMLDVSLYGLNPAGHHLSAVILHAANAILCFLVLRSCTGVTWPAALAAALFAIHPLRAESVAYISERKDVLSVLFWFLTMASWLRYLRRPTPGRYLAALGVFALGLMAKPMLITLPFVLLLLDFWPFDRLRRHASRQTGPVRRPQWVVGRLVLEKSPWFVLAIVSSALAYAAEKAYGALSPVEPFPLGVRLLNVLFSYGWYLVKTVWPSRLGAFYPHPGPSLSPWSLLAAAALLTAVSVVAVRSLRQRPFVAVGWFWFLGTLVPVSGLVQIGDMGRADRFTYLPSVGLSIMLCWWLAGWTAGRPRRLASARYAAIVLIPTLAILSFRQVAFWRDGLTLFSHTVEVGDVNSLARYNLSVALAQAGRREEAARELSRTIEEDPGYVPAYNDLGILLYNAGQPEQAVATLSAGIARFPRSHRLHFRLGLILKDLGSAAAAISEFEEALRLRPDYVEAHIELGALLGNLGRLDEAERHFRDALSLDPASELARWNLLHVQQIKGGGPR